MRTHSGIGEVLGECEELWGFWQRWAEVYARYVQKGKDDSTVVRAKREPLALIPEPQAPYQS